VIPQKAEDEIVGQVLQRPTRNMPSIDLIVNELVVRGRDVGRLEVDARNSEEAGVPVWTLDKLELANPDATLNATASWRSLSPPGDEADDENELRRTALDFKLDIRDAGQLVERFGLPRTIKSGSGTVSGNAGWDGSPTSIALPTLNGAVAVDLRHGQILKVEPGAAKLIGVLSLQGLAHLLTYNQDVVGKGLPFEKITGTGKLASGIGRTDDFTMVTSLARVDVTGLVNLPDKTQDLHAHVTPTVSASAVALGTTIINPLIGLGTLAANYVLSESISKAFARDYSITGSWSKPKVQRLHGDQGKIETPAAATVD
jgi:uncharacterized protein YhdP